MKHIICRLVVMIAFIISVIAPLADPSLIAAQNSVYQEDFESSQAKGWDLESGWNVILDGSNHVLAGEGHFWARSNQYYDGDFRLSFRVKLIAGSIHLVYRLNDIGRYFIGFYSAGSYLNKQIWPDEFHSDLAQSQAGNSLNSWHQIEIDGQGSELTFFIDGKQTFKYNDPSPLLDGSFAFETLDDSQAYIDDIDVTQEATSQPTALQPTAPNQPVPLSELSWVRTGGPLGGLGYDIRMRPDDPDRMYVTDAYAGVFASDDGGLTWYPSSEGITTRTGYTGDAIPVFSLTIDPTSPDTIWVGTQFQRGIFKSVDGGETWSKMVSGIIEEEGITFRGFSVDPKNSSIVYAAAELSSWAWSSDHQAHIGREFDRTAGVIYKTTNGGQSWQAVWRGDNLARYVWINPQDTDVLYISTGFFDREAANSDPVAGTPGGEGILKSTDGGKTWVAVNNGLDNLYVTSLFMHPANPDILLAAAGNNQYNDGGGVYLTTNGGQSWTNTIQDIERNFEAVEISSSDPSIAYAGNEVAIYRSEDSGNTWRKVTQGQNWGPPGVCAGFPIDFQVDPRDPDRIFANEYGGGNFLSVDGGKTWVDASRGYTGAQVRDVIVDPAQSGRVIAAARSGLFISYDGGNRWEGLSYPPVASMEWNAAAMDPGDNQHILAATNWNGLAESKDGGFAWRLTVPLGDVRMGWRTIVFAPSDPMIAYAGLAGFYSAGVFDSTVAGGGIYVSRDGGGSWKAINNAISQDAHVAGLAVSPVAAEIVYAATTNHGLLKTTDGGQNWAQVSGGLPGTASALSVAFQPDNPEVIFVGLERGAIFKSADGGANWHRSASGLHPEASVSDIVFDPTVPGTVYLADMFSGVYGSGDGGNTWKAINTGFYSRAVNALAVSGDGMHLYAATEGNGVYRMDLNNQPPEAASIESTAQPTGIEPNITTTPDTGIVDEGSPTDASMTAPSAQPFVQATVSPTSTSDGKLHICGLAFVPPFGLVGFIFWQASRKRARR